MERVESILIDGNLEPLNPSDRPTETVGRSGGSGKASEPSPTDPNGDEVELSGMDIHDQNALRATAARLIASGDLDSSVDGSVRQGRIDAARRNLGNGTYNRREIIAGIVDRLLEKWRI